MENKQESDKEKQATGMEEIRKFLGEKLHISEPSSSEEKVLSSSTLEGIIEFIKNNNITKIITLVGAGISTTAGIPDFRSANYGMYFIQDLKKHKLPYPGAVFELDYFKKNPEPFFDLAKKLLPNDYKPTLSHYFIRLLNEKGMLLRHYTQNIDTLERLAGLPEEKLVEAHGTFNTGHCLECSALYDLPWMKEQIHKVTIPKCEECKKGIVKPDIVFFGEMLPDRFHSLIEKDFPEAELLIIMGTSLGIQPCASLVDRVKINVPRLLINLKKVRNRIGAYDRLASFLGFQRGLDFSSGRDVAWLGKCDKGCQLLADQLGWGEELKELIKKEHKRLDSEIEESKDAASKEKRCLDTEKASSN